MITSDNPYIVLCVFVLFFGTVACFATKDDAPLALSFLFLTCAGLGYLFYLTL